VLCNNLLTTNLYIDSFYRVFSSYLSLESRLHLVILTRRALNWNCLELIEYVWSMESVGKDFFFSRFQRKIIRRQLLIWASFVVLPLACTHASCGRTCLMRADLPFACTLAFCVHTCRSMSALGWISEFHTYFFHKNEKNIRTTFNLVLSSNLDWS